jgi:hypothetical protein
MKQRHKKEIGAIIQREPVLLNSFNPSVQIREINE